MWPYWMLFFGFCYFAITQKRELSEKLRQKNQSFPFIWRVVLLILTLMIGFRHEVGGDWAIYLEQINGMQSLMFMDVLLGKDPA